MKSLRFLIPVVAAFIAVTCFVQCQKNSPLGFKIDCKYAEPDTIVEDGHGHFYIDTSKYFLYDSVAVHYNYIDTTLANLRGTIKKGVAEFSQLRYPALLRVVLYTDTMANEDSTQLWYYRDTIEVKVSEDNIVTAKKQNPATANARLNKYFIR